MMITKTNRLSTERLYSVMYPAKNSPAYWPPKTIRIPSPNRIAQLT